ncbi:MAG: ATP-grasp domain-containing protein [Alphaproteobacteria bacterium]|nr:ATP-grasp domain-containing protein [Alphaproteobacteria bacterium]
MRALHQLSRGVLVTGVGAPPGLGTLRSLIQADPGLNLVAADLNALAGGLYEPGARGITLPAAADAEGYRSAVRAAMQAYDCDIIIPGSEAEAKALAPVAPAWKKDGLRVPLPAPDVLEFGLDKGKLLDRVRACGLPHPQTLQPQTAADLDGWSGGFPCVVKPRTSRGARGVSYPESAEELAEIWAETHRDHGPSLVQQFIPGGAETVYTIGSLWRQGELIVSTLHRKLQTNPPSGGVAIAGETVEDDALMQAGLDILRASGPWHGLAAVELKRPAPGAPPYLLEINPRMWGFGYLMTLAGLNIPDLLVRMCADDPELGNHIPDRIPPYSPTRMTRTWMDVEIPMPVENDKEDQA